MKDPLHRERGLSRHIPLYWLILLYSFCAFLPAAYAQTGYLSIVNGVIDFSGAGHTVMVKRVASVGALPSTGCTPGEWASVTAAAVGKQMYQNSGTGTCVWTQQYNLTFTPLNPTNNLSDLANAGTARTNLGLGTAATQATGTFAQVANNLSDLANAATARTNLGVSAATLKGTTGSIGGGLLAAGACSTGTVNIVGATTSMTASVSPALGVDPTNGGVLGVSITARVSSAGVVTVSVCSPIVGTPTAATYAVTVYP